MSLKDRKCVPARKAVDDFFNIPGMREKLDEARFDLKHPRLARLKGWMRKARQAALWLAILAAYDIAFVFVFAGGRIPHL